MKIDDSDVNKILVSKEKPYCLKNSFKYFIRYIHNDVIRPLCIKLPQMIRYVRSFESNTTMSFKISDKQLLKKYNQMWKKVKNLLKIKFDSDIKTKIKIYDGNVNTSFPDKGMPKEKASCKCLSIIRLDSVFKVKKRYYPQTLLEECKYQIKKTEIENLLDDNLEKGSSDESDNETDNDFNDENGI